MVILLVPVGACVVGLTLATVGGSNENEDAYVPTCKPTLAIAECATPTPADILQCRDTSSCHTLASHAVGPSLALCVYCTVPRSFPCSVMVSAPVVASVTVSKEDRVGGKNVNDDAYVPTCTPTLAIAECATPTPADILQCRDTSSCHTLASYAVGPSLALCVYCTVPRSFPCSVMVSAPVVASVTVSKEDRVGGKNVNDDPY